MVQFVQTQISNLLNATGLDNANLKVLLCTLLSFPFSAIFKRLPDNNYTLKHGYILTISSMYIFVILELNSGLITLLFSSLGCYFITRYLRTWYMPWVNFLFLMTHLFYHHLHQQFFQVYDPTVIDLSGALMVMVMKLSSFGWSIYDAKVPQHELTEYSKSRVIKKHPNILPYLGYAFFYPSLLTGPAFDFADYERFISSTLFEDVPESRRPGKRKRRIPRSGLASLQKTMQGFFFAFLFFQAPKYFNTEYIFLKEFVNNHGFIYRILYLWLLNITYRLKYYTIWLIAEGACILCGIGYNGYNETTNKFMWDRVQNIDPWVFETGQNVHVCLEAWNMNTNKWLKNYVYLRVAKKGKKPGFKSTLLTFGTSAFWHGTRPGYYLTFVGGAFSQTLGKIFRRNLRPMFINSEGTPSKYKFIYDIVCYFTTQLCFGFITQPFVILDLKPSLYCWSTVYFCMPVVTVIVLFLFRGPWSGIVIDWCRSKHMKLPPRIDPRLLNREETRTASNMLMTYLSKDSDRLEAPSLGVPSLEDLDAVDKSEFDEDMRQLIDVWNSFRDRSVSNDNALRDAYNNFVEEIDDIFKSQKQVVKEKSKEESKALAEALAVKSDTKHD